MPHFWTRHIYKSARHVAVCRALNTRLPNAASRSFLFFKIFASGREFLRVKLAKMHLPIAKLAISMPGPNNHGTLEDPTASENCAFAAFRPFDKLRIGGKPCSNANLHFPKTPQSHSGAQAFRFAIPLEAITSSASCTQIFKQSSTAAHDVFVGTLEIARIPRVGNFDIFSCKR